MAIALFSLAVLVLIIIISCITPRVNPGILSLAAVLVIGTYVDHLTLEQLIANFPTQLFILLVLMSFIFTAAYHNGALINLTTNLLKLVQGRICLLPPVYFLLAFLLSALGPGNITAVALLAPIVMSLSSKYKLSLLVSAIMICTGANAGAFSPFAPTGVVASGLISKINLPSELAWQVFVYSAVIQSFSALGAYLIFLYRSRLRGNGLNKQVTLELVKNAYTQKQILTLLLIAALIFGVTILNIKLLIMASIISVLVMIFNLADETQVFKKLPWSVIIMVCGIATFIGLLEDTGGLNLATDLIAANTSTAYINSVLAFITGVVSAFSSSSGVVMPAFIPLIPGLIAKMSLTDPIPLLVAVAVGSHMVDVSPLSTLGALSLAAVDQEKQRQRLFRYLLTWGMMMSFVGAILAFVFLDLLMSK